MSGQVIHGDCFEEMPRLEAESFDSCVTDPPYGIGFMGREWDTFKPEAGESRIVPNRLADSDNPNLKGRTRGPASSPSAVEYDRSLGGQRAFQQWNEAWGRQVMRLLKPGAYAVVCGAPRSTHRMASGLEDAGFEIRDTFAWLFGQGFPKSLNLGDGRGTALKPAHEPIVLARKPFRGTVAANVAKHGTGALNIEACRIGTTKDVPASESRSDGGDIYGNGIGPGSGSGSGFDPNIGRWPTNLILTHSPGCNGTCAPDCPVRVLDGQSGACPSPGGLNHVGEGGLRHWRGDGIGKGRKVEAPRGFADSGGASRFFPVFSWDPALDVPFLYCPKASRSERDAGCEHLQGRARDPSRDPEAPGANNPRNRGGQQRANHHPTVKPVALMRWLCRLVTPPGGRILEPFCGSGTTPLAAQIEGFECVAIEREAEFVEVAQERIRGEAPLFAECAP